MGRWAETNFAPSWQAVALPPLASFALALELPIKMTTSIVMVEYKRNSG